MVHSATYSPGVNDHNFCRWSSSTYFRDQATTSYILHNTATLPYVTRYYTFWPFSLPSDDICHVKFNRLERFYNFTFFLFLLSATKSINDQSPILNEKKGKNIRGCQSFYKMENVSEKSQSKLVS